MTYGWRQRVLVIGATAVLVSSVVVAFGVIPLVRADTFPGAAPHRAIPALWVNALFGLLAAVAAATASRLKPDRVTLRRVLASASGFVAVLLGLVLIDAAAAFLGHGPGMRGAVVALWLCVCLNVAGGVAMVGAAVARQR